MSEPRPPRRRLTTVREVCQEYLDRVVRGKADASWRTKRTEITQFMAVNGEITLDDRIADDLEKFIEERPSLKSPWTKKRFAEGIKRCFSWCWNKGLISSHPLKGVSYQVGKRREAMSEEHFRALLRNVGVELRRALLFLYWTGCRPIELCALKWAFIDTEKFIAVLHEHKTAHSRKDGEPRVNS